ncbi:protein stum homolog [Mytilus californianus]|uniref:protein stum homolog n=1 Tax=Mytilus californianus TaxID=6549 RepID=UPI0022486823|nr:protein stum homolog [Mytilus californianus]
MGSSNADGSTTNDKKKNVHRDSDIVEINEKHGPLYNAIPRMHPAAAIILCLLNICAPGFGTFISSFTVFCGAQTKISKRRNAFLLNLLAAFLQMVTFLVIVGWIWSILWGMNFVQIALKKDDDVKIPYYARRQSSVDFLT